VKGVSVELLVLVSNFPDLSKGLPVPHVATIDITSDLQQQATSPRQPQMSRPENAVATCRYLSSYQRPAARHTPILPYLLGPAFQTLADSCTASVKKWWWCLCQNASKWTLSGTFSCIELVPFVNLNPKWVPPFS
jgi:hypothetical protein